MGKVLLIGEIANGQLKKSAGQLVTAARVFGADITGAALGLGANAAAAGFGAYGVAQALALDIAAPHYSSDGFARALAVAVRDGGFEYIVLMQSQFGRDVGARLAAMLGAGWINDVTALTLTPEGVVATKPLYAGKLISHLRFKGAGVKILTLRPKTFTPAEAGAGSASVSPIAPPAEYKSQVTQVLAKEEGQIDLKEADIIISGGRGVGGPEGFAPLREFAKAVGCALGASRAAVDAGWIEHSHQVGQTGKVVNPQLYIACGISGAIQHLAGMQTSKYILAINSNPDAPIFKLADYGLTGDLFAIIPELQKQILALRDS